MEDERFDRLTRSFALSRRTAVRAIAGGALGILGQALGQFAAVAKPKPPKSDDPFYRAMKSCRRGEACGSMAPCDPDYDVCMPTACQINGEIYRLGESNPENFCQVRNATTWSRWLNRHRDETCPD